MKALKFVLILMLLPFKAEAGGMMKGGGLDDLVTIIFLIYIGIPILIGGIVAVVSKQRKSLNFFLGLIISFLILVIGTFIYIDLARS